MSKYSEEYIIEQHNEAKTQYNNTIKNIDIRVEKYDKAAEKFQAVESRLLVLENEYEAARNRYKQYIEIFETEKQILNNLKKTCDKNEMQAQRKQALEQYNNRIAKLYQ